MDNGLNVSNSFILQNSGVMFHNEKLPRNMSNFISGRFNRGVNPVRLNALQLKKIISNEFLTTLFDSDFVRLLSYLEPVTLSAGEDIYQADEPVKYAYFPENAVFSQLNILEDGRMCEISMVGKEGVVGFPAMFNSCLPKFWTQISVAGTAFKIRTDVFRREFAHSTTIQVGLFDYANIYISQISQKATCNNYHRIEERFCTWLLMLQDRCGSNRLNLTHEQIAGYLGVNRPSITHVTQALREQKVIDYLRGKIYILDRNKLKKSACVCYTAVNKSLLNSFCF